MKTLSKISSLLIFTSIIFMACQKETSFEQGNSTASIGSLSVDASGNCLGAVVSGTYMKDTAIKASNYVDVSVKVDTVGTYIISSDTVNGYYFKATGTFGATGTQTVRLVGGGKPLVIGTNIFRVTYNGTVCDFTVTVTAPPPPTGGSAAFTFNCTGATPVGTYVAGTALTAANTITLNVTVTTVGTWSVTTAPAVNGITFSGSGTFAATGAQTIILAGSGTPTAAGTNTFTVTGGTSACTFQCTTTAVAISDYFPLTTNSNWSYDEITSTGVDTFLSKVIPQTLVSGGNTYHIILYSFDAAQGFDTLGYYRRSGPNYYEWGDMSYGGLDNPVRGEFIFLKDDQPANTKWTSTTFSGPATDPNTGVTSNFTLRWEMTIVQKDVNLTVGSTNYTNVIQVKQELQLQTGPTIWTPLIYYQNYFARDKGLVKQERVDVYTGTPVVIWTDNVKRFVIY
jgi:hypothetical protein